MIHLAANCCTMLGLCGPSILHAIQGLCIEIARFSMQSMVHSRSFRAATFDNSGTKSQKSVFLPALRKYIEWEAQIGTFHAH
jgi:hypothetical protein